VGGGAVIDIRINRGDRVSAGQLIAVVDNPELRDQIESARLKLAAMESNVAKSEPLADRRNSMQANALDAQRAILQRKIRQAGGIGPEIRQKQIRALQMQMTSLRARIVDARQLSETLRRVRDSRRELRNKELISDTAMLEAERNYVEAKHRLGDLQAQFSDLEIRELEIRRAYIESQNIVADLEAQLRELDTKHQELTISTLQTKTTIADERMVLRRQIEELEHQLRSVTLVTSQVDGSILEVNAVLGQMVPARAKLAAIQTHPDEDGDAKPGDSTLQGVAYFSVADGKRIKPGMKVQLTPAIVKRVEFGGITGTVTHVSAFPVSRESAANMVNSEEVAAELTKEGKTIEVVANLDGDPDSLSGFKWSASKGPSLRVTAGTTGTMVVDVEDRAPITLVFPFLRGSSGL
jgi:HlyD family secretion protein